MIRCAVEVLQRTWVGVQIDSIALVCGRTFLVEQITDGDCLLGGFESSQCQNAT